MPTLKELEPEFWSELEFGACVLGDQRRTRRLVRYARQMAEKPDASTPRQAEGWPDCKAVYRLFERPEVTFEAVTAAHYQRTRNLAPGKYLVISDTTEVDYGYKSAREGLGLLTAEHRRGFFLHSALVVEADTGDVMGLGAQELWARPHEKKRRVHRVACRKRPTEADVWGRVMNRVQATRGSVQFVHVCDRGADNFDVFAHLHEQGDSWVIRAAQLTRKVRAADGRVIKLGELMKSAPLQGTYQVYVSANRNQVARWAQVEVRAASVTLLRPREGSTAFVLDRNIREVPTNVVQVQEVDPPKNCKPLQWVLYCAEPVSSFLECQNAIAYYERRPLVEEYHQCLKTGLQIEARQYESADRLQPVIGMICVQAVRLLQLRHVARRAPETPARKLVPPEWLDVLRLVLRNPRPLNTVRDFIRGVASLGGFLGRKSDGEPGWKTIWRGLETLLVALRGYRAARRKYG
jgi:Transposase DNA-binding/Transposase Tn5 dimerisation domain